MMQAGCSLTIAAMVAGTLAAHAPSGQPETREQDRGQQPPARTERAPEARVPPWIAALQVPRPGHAPPTAPTLPDLLDRPGGGRVRTGRQWAARREALHRKWVEFLGELPRPRCPLRPRVKERVVLEGGVVREKLLLQVEPGIDMRCYLFLPPGADPCPACVCLHSTTAETIRQPAGLGAQREKAFALDLVRRHYVTIAPENFLWSYPVPDGGSGYLARARSFLRRHPGVKGMAKMIHDASRCVDYLWTLPRVKKDAIGAIGHSLGAKEVTFLMAFDQRVACGVSSEGGVGFDFSNYQDPWYLGPAIRKERSRYRAHEVLALVAPRAWLLIGGNSADGDRSWPYVRAVLPLYRLLGAPGAVGLFVHDKGHAVPPAARKIAFSWLDHHLRRTGSAAGTRKGSP